MLCGFMYLIAFLGKGRRIHELKFWVGEGGGATGAVKP